jgi:hypothetical protein
MSRTAGGASKPLKRDRVPESAVFAPPILPVANISPAERITADPKMLRFQSTELDFIMPFGCGGPKEVCEQVVK